MRSRSVLIAAALSAAACFASPSDAESVCQYRTKPPALANNDQVTLQCDASGNLLIDSGAAAATAPYQASFVDRSGSVTTGGTSQVLAVANANRRRIIINNPSTALAQGIALVESLYINFDTAASTSVGSSLEIVPGGTFDSGAGPVSTQAINVTAATSAHKFAAKEQ